MTQPAVVEKKDEKAEKRKALGRGLASLLPGPRVVASPESRISSAERGGAAVAPNQGGDGVGEQQVPHFVRNDNVPEERSAALAPTVAQAGAALHTVTDLAVELIDKNPYQTRSIFDEILLNELADSIRQNGVVQPVVVRPSERWAMRVLCWASGGCGPRKWPGSAM